MTTTINASPSNGLVQTADGSGILKVQSNGVTTNALAWVNFNGTTSPGTIRSSYNVGSVTKNATGDYTLNFTNALSDANYAACVNGCNATATGTGAFGPYNAAPTTSAYRFGAVNLSGVTQPLADMAYAQVIIFGN